ncbi:MAG TPA: hypothetical protein VMV72_18595 [Verrucomicrobiae bacterium]|nr:hypothetical protein [Verrucomicrobiae bacterium]
MIGGLTILPFRPNWVHGVTLRSTYATAQRIESTGGSMTRTSERDHGQRQIKFTALLHEDFRRQWDAFRELNPPGTLLGIPLWSEEGIVLTAPAASGALALQVSSTANIDWRGEAVLVAQASLPAFDLTVEGFEISSVTGNTINLGAGLANAFNTGDEVLPLMRARQVADYAEMLHTPETSEIELTFDEDLSFMSAVQYSTTPAYPTYLSLPVLPLIAEWSQSPKTFITKRTHFVASGLNTQVLATLGNYVSQRIAHRVGMDGRTDRALLWQFFHDRKGRFSRFWLPSLKNELKLAANAAPADTTLQLANLAQFSSRYALGGDLHRAIFITDGVNWWIRQVINLSGGTNRVTIDSPLGGAGVPAGGCQIGMLTLVQFAADDLEIELDAPVVARADIAFNELEKEYGEVVEAESGDASGTRQGQELIAA